VVQAIVGLARIILIGTLRDGGGGEERRIIFVVFLA
jgi:hypothetical protein